jgi:hypothetical protein
MTRPVAHRGRPLSSYSDPHPGAKGSDKVADACGMCDGGGVYQGYSRITWQRGRGNRAQIAPWCFWCNGSGKRFITVATLRKRAKEAAYQRDYAEEIAAAQAAEQAAYAAKAFAKDWDEAHAEQARRAALVTGFAGEVGQRVRGLPGVVRFEKSYDASYGYHRQTGKFLIVELANGQVVKIAGTGGSLFGHERGDRVLVTGTVKAHETYNGQDQTVLTRAALEAAESEEGEGN